MHAEIALYAQDVQPCCQVHLSHEFYSLKTAIQQLQFLVGCQQHCTVSLTFLLGCNASEHRIFVFLIFDF